MEKIMMTTPTIREIADKVANNFPTGFKPPYQVFVRTAFLERKEDLIDGAEIAFEFPGVGTLTFTGRAYSFAFDNDYAAAKNYPEHVEGNWG